LVIPSPNTGLGNNFLDAVAAPATDDAWAVGGYDDQGTLKATILHWDGEAWQTTPSPADQLDSASLTDVTAISADDVWAVGEARIGGAQKTLTMHWNGSVWSVVPSPNGPGASNAIEGVSFSSPTNGWAVGESGKNNSSKTLVMHFDGKQWRLEPSPSRGYSAILDGVAAVSGTDAWAVGVYYFAPEAGFYKSLMLHFIGGEWRVESNGPANVWGGYQAVDRGERDVWAAGGSWSAGKGPRGNLISQLPAGAQHWKRVTDLSLATRSNLLDSVVEVSPSSVWAAGKSTTASLTHPADRSLVVHWNGSAWSSVPVPHVGSGDNDLTGLAEGDGVLWAVGSSATDAGGGTRTLIIRACPV
jgi:hypothetical protein